MLPRVYFIDSWNLTELIECQTIYSVIYLSKINVKSSFIFIINCLKLFKFENLICHLLFLKLYTYIQTITLAIFADASCAASNTAISLHFLQPVPLFSRSMFISDWLFEKILYNYGDFNHSSGIASLKRDKS